MKSILKFFKTYLLVLLVFSVFLCSCSSNKQNVAKDKANADTVTDTDTDTETDINIADNSEDMPDLKNTAVEDLLNKMTLDEKIYQMLFVTPEALTGIGQVIAAGKTTQDALNKYPVGGIIYFSSNLQNKEQILNMMQNVKKFSKIPLFLGVDEEGGRVSRLGSNSLTGVTSISTMRSIGETHDPAKAYEVGETLGKEIYALGFNVDFAPVADVLINSGNTEIGDRSFGTDPLEVSAMVENEVLGLQNNKVSAVLKHFPGHGSTVTDSHINYSESTRTVEELQNCEFLPFKAGIDAGSDFVLISHATFVNAVNEKCPASVSKEIITDHLINGLGFGGIVITDSFSMGAITNNYSTEEAVEKALAAGVDMILMPDSIEKAFTGIKKAVESGKISEDRIDQSVLKILNVKRERGIL